MKVTIKGQILTPVNIEVDFPMIKKDGAIYTYIDKIDETKEMFPYRGYRFIIDKDYYTAATTMFSFDEVEKLHKLQDVTKEELTDVIQTAINLITQTKIKINE